MEVLNEYLSHPGVGLGLTVGGLYLSRQQVSQEMLQTRALHKAELEAEKNCHEKSLMTLKKTYLLDMFYSIQQHFQQLNSDLIGSTRESERDMFDQRNQGLQTIILASSVMFSALSTIIVQGYLPTNAAHVIFVMYAAFSTLSFLFLFLSIVICIEVSTAVFAFVADRGNRFVLLLATSRRLFTAYCLLFNVYCSLFIPYCLLLTVCCLLGASSELAGGLVKSFWPPGK